MRCDIIIPIYNNARQLPYTLPALQNQAVPADWQLNLHLADDGSTDQSLLIAKRLCRACPWPCHFSTGSHAGAAAARNRAIAKSPLNNPLSLRNWSGSSENSAEGGSCVRLTQRQPRSCLQPNQTNCSRQGGYLMGSKAESELLLLLGADIILRPGALQAHLNFHVRFPDLRYAALGFVLWDPRLSPTPLMEWMAHGGSQNNYDALLGQSVADPRHYFYGSHLSLKRVILPPQPFSTAYRSYGWEDLDLGRRLAAQHRLQLYVLPEAIGHHRHYYSARQIFCRQQAIGYGFREFQARHPAVASSNANSLFHYLKYKLIYYTGALFILSQITNLLSSKWSTPTIYKLAINSHFWHGFHQTYPHK